MTCNQPTLIVQTPYELLDYTINWPTRGLPTGATIASFTLAGSSSDFTLSNESITGSTNTITFWLTGGVPGNFYTITNSITLSTGQVMQETVEYECIAQRFI